MTDEREPLKSMNESHKPPTIMPDHDGGLAGVLRAGFIQTFA